MTTTNGPNGERPLRRDAHHLRGVLDEAAAARMMISARAGAVSESRTVLRDELGAKRVEPRIADRRGRREDEFPIGRLLRAQRGRTLQQMRLLFGGQRARLPTAGVETRLLVLVKLAGDFDEISRLHGIAGSEIGMVAPDAQHHAINRVGERKLAVRFLIAGRS